MAVAAALLLLSNLAWAEGDGSHRAPAPSTAERIDASEVRRKVLSEMWDRRILPPDANSWSPEDLELLQRVRRAESAGALNVLRRRVGALGGLAAEYRPVGALSSSLRLTKEGYERYLSLRTQDALAYLEEKEIGAKVAFKLTDIDNQPLFDARGLLTEAGDRIFSRARAGLEAHWKMPNGAIMGNRRPPPQPAAAPEPAPAPGRRRPSARPPEAEPAKAPEPEKKPEENPSQAPKSDAKPSESESP